MNSTTDAPGDGEIRRVVVAGKQDVGVDAIVDFGDVDRPGSVHRAVVLSADMTIGDRCSIQFRAADRVNKRPRWIFVERLDE